MDTLIERYPSSWRYCSSEVYQWMLHRNLVRTSAVLNSRRRFDCSTVEIRRPALGVVSTVKSAAAAVFLAVPRRSR